LLVTVDEFKNFIYARGDRPEDIERWTAALVWAEQMVKSYTKFAEYAEIEDEIHDPRIVVFPNILPLREVTTVKLAGAELDSTDWYAYELNVHIPSIVYDECDPQSITITYAGGVTRDDLEADPITGVVDTTTVGYRYLIHVMNAIKNLAQASIQRNMTMPGGRDAESFDIQAIIFEHLPRYRSL